MSILSSTQGKRLACSTLHVSRTILKLSCMHRPLMNALWFGLTSMSSLAARQFAKHYVISLLKQ